MWILVGALVGAAAGAIGTIITAKLRGQPINWRDVGAAALTGAVTGAIASATFGVGAIAASPVTRVVAGAAIGALAGAGGRMLSNEFNGRPLWQGVKAATISGAVGGAIGIGALGPIAPGVLPSVTRTVVSGSLGNGAAQATDNLLEGRPILEGVPQAMTAGGLVAGGARVAAPYVAKGAQDVSDALTARTNPPPRTNGAPPPPPSGQQGEPPPSRTNTTTPGGTQTQTGTGTNAPPDPGNAQPALPRGPPGAASAPQGGKVDGFVQALEQMEAGEGNGPNSSGNGAANTGNGGPNSSGNGAANTGNGGPNSSGNGPANTGNGPANTGSGSSGSTANKPDIGNRPFGEPTGTRSTYTASNGAAFYEDGTPVKLFRGIAQTPEGQPETGSLANDNRFSRNLSIRNNDFPKGTTITPDTIVGPGTDMPNGLSTSPSPETMSPQAASAVTKGKTVLYELDTQALQTDPQFAGKLKISADPNNPQGHFMIEPAVPMTFSEFENLIHATARLWKPTKP